MFKAKRNGLAQEILYPGTMKTRHLPIPPPGLNNFPYKCPASVGRLHSPHGTGSVPTWCWAV